MFWPAIQTVQTVRPISVDIGHLAPSLFAIGQIRKILLRALAVVLLFLRPVDLMESDLGLPVVRIKHRQGVAICDNNDPAGANAAIRSARTST